MSRLQLATQLLLWWLADDPRLPAAAVAIMQAPGAEVFVSQLSLWELATKQRQGLVALEALPAHADPFDLLLIAQSRLEPLLLLTADPGLQPHGAMVQLLDPKLR